MMMTKLELRTYFAAYELRIITLEQDFLELRYNHNHDDKGRFCSGGGGGNSLDKSADKSYNMFRKTKNTGDFQSLSEPMQMRHIKSIIRDLGIDCKGIEFDIVRDKELIGKNVFGYTFPDGKRVQLYPDAFQSRKELVKTIGHERIHCEQIKLFGNSRSMSELIEYEKAAAFSENYWWSEYVRKTGYNESK